MKHKHPNKKIKISIITVCFNSSKTIRKTIESVLDQNYDNFEYIIIDGNSIDNTLDIVKEYKSRLKEKLIIHCEQDYGVYDAINKGIKMASGEIINVISSNDWLQANILKDIAGFFMVDPSIDILHGNIMMQKEIGDNTYTGIRKGGDPKSLNKVMSVNHPSCFVRSSWYSKLAYNKDYKIAGDHDFMLKSYKMGAKFKYIDRIIMIMTVGGLSNSFKTSLESYHVLKTEGYYKNAYLFIFKRAFSISKSIILRRLGKIILSKKRFEKIEIAKWNTLYNFN